MPDEVVMVESAYGMLYTIYVGAPLAVAESVVLPGAQTAVGEDVVTVGAVAPTNSVTVARQPAVEV